MKIKFNKRPIRKAGFYTVKITYAKPVSAGNKHFYNLKLENETSFIYQKVFTDKTHVVIDIIFNLFGLKRCIFDDNSDLLINKELSVNVIEKNFIEPENHNLIKQYFNIKEFRSKDFNWNSLYSLDNDEDNSASLEEVFGVDREEVARAMGKDPNDVSDSDIWEYSGY